MPRRDSSKVEGLFPELSSGFVTTPKTSTRPNKEKKGKSVSASKQSFITKLNDGLFEEFEKQDWLHYWQHKAMSYGIKYIVGNYIKEYAILSSLMKNFKVKEIKAMIDFIFDSNQDIHDKRTVGVWILSKGWINTIYQSTVLWQSGEYKTKAEASTAPKRNREWTGEEESPKESKKSSIRI